jgi:hypothetical protein
MAMAYIEGHAPYNKWCWLLTLREVARMPSLKRLQIDMVIATQGMSAEYEDLLFADIPVFPEVEVAVRCNWEEGVYRQDWPMDRVWPFGVTWGVQELEEKLEQRQCW